MKLKINRRDFLKSTAITSLYGGFLSSCGAPFGPPPRGRPPDASGVIGLLGTAFALAAASSNSFFF